MKPFLWSALAILAISVALEIFAPASARVIDIAALVFAVATWIIPPLRFAFGGNNLRGSLARVGFHIHVIVLAACLSAVALMLAIVTLLFAPAANWAWPAILMAVAFWPAAFQLLYIANLLSPPPATRKPEAGN